MTRTTPPTWTQCHHCVLGLSGVLPCLCAPPLPHPPGHVTSWLAFWAGFAVAALSAWLWVGR